MKSLLRAWWAEYPKKSLPNHSKIKKIISNFEKYGSVARVAPK